ncbi:hypothetical protein [Flavobacterium sp.]
MKTFRIVGLIVCMALIIFHIYSLDYEDLRFRANKLHYLQILVMLLVGMTFLLGVIKDRKK